jgi:lipid-binding SYLF domain-containing protein
MRKTIIGVLVCASSVFAVSPKDRKEVDNRLSEAAVVFSEIMNAPDKGIPRDLLDKAHCAVVIPGVKKGAFIVGAQYGKGFISCRGKSDRLWSAPAAIRLEGGSFGFQIGGSETDVVMLVMNDRGADRLLSSQFTLGGEGEVAAGPVGRSTTAQTDAKVTADIHCWARARGVIPGIARKGAKRPQDVDDNEAMYNKRLETRDIVRTRIAATAAGRKLITALDRRSPREKS